MKIKILYVISSLRPCGPDNVMVDIMRNLDFNKFDISVLALSESSNDGLKRILEGMGIKCYSFGLSRLEYFFLGSKKMRNIIESLKPDIVHTHCIRSTVLIGFLKKINCIKCVTIHNYPHLDYIYGYGKVIGTISGKIMLQAIKQFDIKIACSKSIKNVLKSKFDIDTVSIQNGVEENKFLKEDKMEMRRRLGIPTDKKVIISVGAISKRKNSYFLVNALKRMGRIDVFVIFLGEGEQLEICKENSIEGMLFLGNKSNVSEYLIASDIYVSASQAEGLPLSVLEALNAGLPVVLSDIEPHSEIVRHFKDNAVGYLYDFNSYDDFSRKLSLMLDEENIELFSRNSLTLGQTVFCSKIMGKQYEDVYLDAISVSKSVY